MRSESPMKVTLIGYTPDPAQVAALAARICYAASDVETLQARVEAEEQGAFLSQVAASGHLSVLEHASFTFAVEGVSRVLLAQLTRHRIASFSVQSQRYVSLGKTFDYVTPPAIAALGSEASAEYDAQMAQMHQWYCAWRERLGGKGEQANEDARFVLPGACQTRLLLTMNARELLHFFALRCCERAQWEIRAMARAMLSLCIQAAPVLFENAGPACVTGCCNEGKRTCGHADQVRQEIAALHHPVE